MRLGSLSVFIAAAAGRLAAQTAGLAVPVSGIFYDEGLRAVRAVRGIPGAAVLSHALASGGLTGAAVASEQRIVVGWSDDGFRVTRLNTGETAMVAGAMAPGRVVLSPSGESAALIGASLQVLTGLADVPAAGPMVERFAPTVAAVSDDGVALVSTGGGDADPVWVVKDGQAAQLAAPGSIVAAAFRAHSGDAAAATKSGDIYLIENAAGGGAARLVVAGDDRTSGPVAMYFGADGRRVYTANAAGTLAILDLETGVVEAISCGCVPTALERLGGALFRITSPGDAPVRLFDAGGATPRVWLIPQDTAAGQGREDR